MNQLMFISGRFPLPSLPSYESLVSVKENTDRKWKKEKKKHRLNVNQTERSSRSI